MHDKTKEEIAAHIQHALDRDKHNLGERGDHQREALKRVAEHLMKEVGEPIVLPEGQHQNEYAGYLTQKQSDHFLVVSATGTGKTRILGGIMDGAEVPTLLLTPRRLLNKQMLREFCDEMDIPEDRVGLIDGNVKRNARKEAFSKPYLISTFQSLPNLVDHTAGHYRLRPELGMRKMCLLDEAHTAQGPQTSAILNDFKQDMILGGVTATEAGVSNTLFNGQAPIFNLDLVTAIHQGKLATGVKTGVIDVKLDEDWVEGLTKTPLGQEYNRKALERFAKTPATIKAMSQFHLSHVDDEIGKVDRFPTLVFTEGIAAASQGVEIFNEMARARGSKARAGFVSGDMDPETRDRMLESFRNGDITVLFNARMLEMGYDLPEATVTYSLKPTQYRHTAEQQLGRVTRKEPKDYFEKYGMHKVALAVNVRPEGVIPYLYGEVLGNSPSLYQAGCTPPSKGGNKNSGGVETYLKLDDAEFHTNYDEIASIIANSPRLNRTRDLLSGFLDRENASNAARMRRSPAFKNAWTQLVEAAELLPREPDGTVNVPYKNDTIKMGFFKNKTHYSWYIEPKSLGSLVGLLGRNMDKPPTLLEGFIDKNKVVIAARTNTYNQSFVAGWEKLIAAAQQVEPDALGVRNITVDNWPIRIGYFRHPRGAEAWYIANDDLANFAKLIGKREKRAPLLPIGFLDRVKVAPAMGVSSNHGAFNTAWTDIISQAMQTGTNESGIAVIHWNGNALTLGYFRSGGREAWYLAEDDCSKVAKYLGRKKSQPLEPGFVPKAEAAKIAGAPKQNKEFIDLWETLVGLAEQCPMQKGGVDIVYADHAFKMGHFSNGARNAWYMDERSTPNLKAVIDAQKDTQASSFSAKLDKKKASITPQSIAEQKTKRSGWGKKAGS